MAGLVLTLALATGASRAQDPDVSYAYLVDPDRSLTIADMRSARFEPVVSTFGGGFTKAAYWLRVTYLQPDPPPTRLRVRPLVVDRIQLYSPRPDGSWQESQNGELVTPVGDAQTRSGWYSFRIDPHYGQRTFYLRITTASPGAIVVSSVPVDDELRDEIRLGAWHTAIFSLQFLAIALTLIRLDPFGSIANFFFFSMLASFAIYLGWVEGYVGPFVTFDDPRTAQTAQEFSAVLTVALLVAFHYFHLREYDPHPWMRRIGLAYVLLAALGPIISIAGFGSQAMVITLLCYLLTVPMLVGLLATLQRNEPIRLPHLRGVYGIYLVVLMLNILGRFGLLDDALLYRHSLSGITLLSSTLILVLLWLQRRSALAIALGREVEIARIAADMSVARDYQDAQTGLVHRIDRLSQELYVETGDALAKGSFGKAADRAMRSVESLWAVVERCIFARQAEGGSWNVTPADFDPGTALRGLALTMAPETSWRFALEPVTIRTDRVLFELAARNILSNALSYKTPDTPVSITVCPALHDGREGAEVTVVNQSPTAMPFNPSIVFDKYYRGPSGKAKSGTGLGLFIAREVLAPLGGTVTLTGPDTQENHADPTVAATLWVPVR